MLSAIAVTNELLLLSVLLSLVYRALLLLYGLLSVSRARIVCISMREEPYPCGMYLLDGGGAFGADTSGSRVTGINDDIGSKGACSRGAAGRGSGSAGTEGKNSSIS